MTIKAGFCACALCFLLSIVGGGTQAQDLPSATEDHGGFALQDQAGSRLLLMSTVARPERLTTAICGDGRRVTVQFQKQQAPGANPDGRQTSSNFERLAGSVFAVVGEPVNPATPCFLASETLLAGSVALKIAAPAGPGACLQRGRFATLRDRPVAHCWPLAQIADKQLALLEFDRRGNDALASLVLVDRSRAMFADYSAEFRGAAQDLWRVDDAGVLSPGGLRIVCALQRGRWYALGVAWSGAEGQSLSLWISDGTERFTKVLSNYWYQAPM